MKNFRKKSKSKFKKVLKISFLVYIILIVSLVLISFFDKNKTTIQKITDKEAYLRAMSIINYKWKYTKKEFDENIKLPFYIVDEKEYVGIPYCYGGQISLDYSNANKVKNFRDAIDHNYSPGNINTKDGYVEKTAGVDCSGFIGATFNIKEKISTSTIDKYFYRININEIKPMDIVNSKGNHVYIYLGETNDKKGILILEATSNRNNKYYDKTVVNYKTNKEFKKDIDERNFIPMRYRNIKYKDFKLPFDKYEYNNSEQHAKNIVLNEKIDASIDYIEDIDFYYFDINKNNSYYILVEKIDFDKEIRVYNEKNESIISKKGKYRINFRGKVFIKVSLKGTKLNKNAYSFKILEK